MDSPPDDRDRPPPTVVQLRTWGYLSTRPGGDTICSIRQAAVLDDGREVTLAEDRGWTTNATWETLSLAHAVANIETAVLPDDAETTAETQEWALFTQRLLDAGVVADVDALRAVPSDVVLVVRR